MERKHPSEIQVHLTLSLSDVHRPGGDRRRPYLAAGSRSLRAPGNASGSMRNESCRVIWLSTMPSRKGKR